ncbi:hypothetical protein BN871_HY_00070 [Paenibacillus sp. P22]|nr:hypothetical protein BN871_HY_00070 [Paenibacillus sp. P22]
MGRTYRIHREAVRLLVHRKCPDSLHDGMSLRILLHRKRQRTVIGVAGEMAADQLGQLGVRLQRNAVMDDKQSPAPADVTQQRRHLPAGLLHPPEIGIGDQQIIACQPLRRQAAVILRRLHLHIGQHSAQLLLSRLQRMIGRVGLVAEKQRLCRSGHVVASLAFFRTCPVPSSPAHLAPGVIPEIGVLALFPIFQVALDRACDLLRRFRRREIAFRAEDSAHITLHPSRVKHKHLAAMSLELVMDDVGLDVESGLGHAVAVPAFAPGLIDLAGLRGDVHHKLVRSLQQQTAQRLDDPQRTDRVDSVHPVEMLVADVAENGSFLVAADAGIVDDQVEAVRLPGHGRCGLLYAGGIRDVQFQDMKTVPPSFGNAVQRLPIRHIPAGEHRVTPFKQLQRQIEAKPSVGSRYKGMFHFHIPPCPFILPASGGRRHP